MPRLQHVTVVAAAALGLAAASACISDRTAGEVLTGTTCSAPSTTSGATLVFVRSFAYDPPAVRIRAGGSVAWVNCEPTSIPHTSTSDAGQWESGNFTPGGAFVRTFPATGTFTYHCALHPSMKASVVVE